MKTRHVSRRFRRFVKANEAVSALEYAVLVGVVTVAVGGALVAFSDNIGDAIKGMGTAVKTASDNAKPTAGSIKPPPSP